MLLPCMTRAFETRYHVSSPNDGWVFVYLSDDTTHVLDFSRVCLYERVVIVTLSTAAMRKMMK